MYVKNIITRLLGLDARRAIVKQLWKDGLGEDIRVTGWEVVAGAREFKVTYFRLVVRKRQKYLIISVLTRTSRVSTYRQRSGILRGIEAWRKVPPCLLYEIE